MGQHLSSRRHVPALDGVRGIAILLVLSFHWIFASLPGWHSSDLTPTEDLVRHIFMLNWAGVDLFFVLSGFLIGGIVLDNAGAHNFFAVFYVRRACRILPPYFLVLALFWLGRDFLPWRRTAISKVFENPLPIWVYLTFLQNTYPVLLRLPGNFGLGDTWSLAVEEQFYLLFPLLLAVLPRRRLVVAICAAIAATMAIRTLIFCSLQDHGLATDINYSILFCRMDALLTGAFAAWAVRDPRWSRIIGTQLPKIKTGVLCMLLVLVGFIVRRWSAGDMPMTTLGFTWVAIMFGGFILIAYFDPPDILESRLLRLFGVRAYSIYLFHRPLGMIVYWAVLGHSESVVGPAGILVTILCLFLVTALADLTWRLFERPMITVGHRMRYAAPSPISEMPTA